MFGQDTMWGDAGPMDWDGGNHDADWTPSYNQLSYNESIGLYTDEEMDDYYAYYNKDNFFEKDYLEEDSSDFDFYHWHRKIDKVHDELCQ